MKKVCIIGGGPAGITVAAALKAQILKYTLTYLGNDESSLFSKQRIWIKESVVANKQNIFTFFPENIENLY